MRYCVQATFIVSAYTYVEADSAAAARELADQRDAILCPSGTPSRDGADPCTDFIIESADGIPLNCKVELVDPKDEDVAELFANHDDDERGDDEDDEDDDDSDGEGQL